MSTSLEDARRIAASKKPILSEETTEFLKQSGIDVAKQAEAIREAILTGKPVVANISPDPKP